MVQYCQPNHAAPAITVTPQIASVLSLLREQSQTLLARLSGSGATAFALCATDAKAAELAARMRSLQPAWWVRACRLGGPWANDPGAQESVTVEPEAGLLRS